MMRVIALVIFSLLFFVAADAQTAPACTTEPGFVCISQKAANAAAQNAQELAATKDKVATLEGVIADKDKTIAENKVTAAKNEADLKTQLAKLTADLATATGQIIELKGNSTRDAAIMDVLLKNSRKKCMPFSVCF